MSDDIKDVIRRVAEGLGLLPHSWDYDTQQSPGCRLAFYFRDDDDWELEFDDLLPVDVVLFAAWAKAAMAKRGWLLQWSPRGVDLHDCFINAWKPGTQKEARFSDTDFDMYDPASEPHAILRACDAALTLERDSARDR